MKFENFGRCGIEQGSEESRNQILRVGVCVCVGGEALTPDASSLKLKVMIFIIEQSNGMKSINVLTPNRWPK